jgi:lambda family phage portal protein
VLASSVLHIIDPVEAGQLRGFFRYAPVLVKLFILDQYDDAELDRKKVAAMFAGFVRRPASDDMDREGSASEDLLPLEPGQLQILDEGEDITFSAPSDVGGNYEAFQYRTLLHVAAGLGLPYANLTSDMLKANYSNPRAALLEFRRRVEAFQHSVLVFQLCRPVWMCWLDAAVLSGALTMPNYEKNRPAMLACSWLPPRWDWVDPQKDIRAEIMALDAGLKSRSQAISERGYDAVAVDAEIAADKQPEKELGILKSDPDKQTSAFPLGTTDTFRTFFVPGNFIECVGTYGEELYARQIPRQDVTGIDILTQSNPLPIMKRPALTVRLVSESAA